MRREGYEFAVSKAEVLYKKDQNGKLLEPMELAYVDVPDEFTGTVIDKLSQIGVKILALRCAGFNNVDTKYAFGKIHILRVPAYSPYAVAEHAIALLLTSIRRIHKAYIRSKDFNFSLSGLTGFDLFGKTVGVIGTGKIGKVFIDICKGFGMKVLAYDKFPDKSIESDNVKYVELKELLKQSDIISLHCPLTEETYHIIGDDALNICKNGVIIINTSRGALVDAESLLEGIKTRKVGAACLDVYEEESEYFFEDYSNEIVKDDELARILAFPNVIMTSHQGFFTKEAMQAIATVTLQNFSQFEKGTIDNEVNLSNA